LKIRILNLNKFQFLDEYYRLIKVVMTSQQNTVDYSIMKEVTDIYHMALDHYKEHILPVIERNQKLATNSQQISFPTFSWPALPSEIKSKDDALIDNQRKEISELKSKVLQIILPSKLLF